jgi:hypothetical protein
VSEASEHIQSFQNLLDAPVSSTGQTPQVRHDGLKDFMEGLYLEIYYFWRHFNNRADRNKEVNE